MIKTSEDGRVRSELRLRDFMRVTLASSLAVGTLRWTSAEQTRKGDMLYRPLGTTGERVSALGLGGYHIGTLPTEQESIRLIRTAIDRGLTFMDNCWDYHDGKSEIWMGKALRDGYRDKVFLMTKIDGQTRKSAARQIDESLQRLGTDRVDLMQFHEMIRPEDPARIFAQGGAMEAMHEAKQAGKIRFIGFTGHKDPAIHLAMIEEARKRGLKFDAVQMPLNVMDAHFKSFEKQVLPVLVKDRTGVLGMKPLGSGDILRSGKVKPIECLHYALNLPTSVVITGIDSQRILDQAFEAVKTFQELSQIALDDLLARTVEPAQTGAYERFKTTTRFDGTIQNPQWLGLSEG
jgi:aryl-alcohol dehydrogenase-like predicted oxidoreductase